MFAECKNRFVYTFKCCDKYCGVITVSYLQFAHICHSFKRITGCVTKNENHFINDLSNAKFFKKNGEKNVLHVFVFSPLMSKIVNLKALYAVRRFVFA